MEQSKTDDATASEVMDVFRTRFPELAEHATGYKPADTSQARTICIRFDNSEEMLFMAFPGGADWRLESRICFPDGRSRTNGSE